MAPLPPRAKGKRPAHPDSYPTPPRAGPPKGKRPQSCRRVFAALLGLRSAFFGRLSLVLPKWLRRFFLFPCKINQKRDTSNKGTPIYPQKNLCVEVFGGIFLSPGFGLLIRFSKGCGFIKWHFDLKSRGIVFPAFNGEGLILDYCLCSPGRAIMWVGMGKYKTNTHKYNSIDPS